MTSETTEDDAAAPTVAPCDVCQLKADDIHLVIQWLTPSGRALNQIDIDVRRGPHGSPVVGTTG